MADMDMSHSLSSLPPLGDPPHMDLELSLTSTYTNTPAGSPLSATVVKYYSMFSVLQKTPLRAYTLFMYLNQSFAAAANLGRVCGPQRAACKRASILV